MPWFSQSTAKANGAAREEAAREEQRKAFVSKREADNAELAKLPFAKYTNVFHRASARSQAVDLHSAMTENQQKETIEQIKSTIEFVMDELHKRCKENDVYAYETHFIRNYLLEQNPLYAEEALIRLTKITGEKLINIKQIEGHAQKLIELEHMLSDEALKNCEHDEAKKEANNEQNAWAREYDKVYAECDRYTSDKKTKQENELSRLIQETESKLKTAKESEENVRIAIDQSRNRWQHESEDISRENAYLNIFIQNNKTLETELERLNKELSHQKAPSVQPSQ